MTKTERTPEHVLIASLGSEPQVVTSALALLERGGQAVQRVVVLHTAGAGSIDAAVQTLRQAFDPASNPIALPLELIPILGDQSQPLPDVETPEAARSAFRAFYQQVRKAKLCGERVHLCIAGGRKTMALFGMLTAQLLFDDDDCLWHLHSAGDFLASKRLYPQPGDEVRLVEVPVVRWSTISPALMDIIQYDDPYAALQRQEDLRLEERLEQARSFVRGALTPAEARTVALLVREGLGDAEIAERLALSPRTVGEHLRSAFRKAQDHWLLPDVDRTQLVALLNFYYLDPAA